MLWGSVGETVRASSLTALMAAAVRPVPRRFAAADLAAVNRSVTPWVVVGLHRMMAAPATWRRK